MTVFLPLVTGTRCQGLKASRRSLAVRGSTSSDISADNNMLGHLCTSVQIRLTFGDKEGKGGRTRSLALKLLYRVHHQVCSKLFFKVFMAFLQADGPIPISKNTLSKVHGLILSKHPRTAASAQSALAAAKNLSPGSNGV